MLNLVITKNSEFNCPEIVNTLPKNESSIEILIATVNVSDILPLSEWFYTLSDKDCILFDENDLLSGRSDKKLHIVAVTCNKYNSDSGRFHYGNATIIHVESADGKTPSEFSALFYIDKNTLSYKLCNNKENIMDTVKQSDAGYVIAVTSNVFAFENLEKLDALDRYMLNNSYCEYLTSPETISLLSADNASVELQDEIVILNSVVGYGDFHENSYNISDYLINDFKTV